MKKFSLFVLFAVSAVSLRSAPIGSVNLGSAGNFAVLANSTVTSTGPTVVTGDLGISPGTALVGFGPGVVLGTKHLNDAVAAAAQLDLTTAYNDAAGRAFPAAIPADIGGTIIVPGLYKAPVSLAITGNVILNGAGVYIFQIPSTLTTSSGSQVILAGGASASNIFWQVGSSATIGTTSIFYGNILAQASITVQTGATLSGRALARTGAVTLDTNAVSKSGGVLTPIKPPLPLPSAGPVSLPTLCLSTGFLPSAIDGNGFTHASGSTSNPHLDQARIDHVLLLSVDGMHALDLANYVKAHPASNLAQLGATGLTYGNASGSRPSDSFPGLLAMITGGSPNSTGVFYDNSYDRKLSPPGSQCKTLGTAVIFDQSIDRNSNSLDAGGGIDTTKLPLDPSKSCSLVFPHSYLRVNTIFEVAKNAGLRTAWTDEHPSYEIVNGPSGFGVDDLYTPESAASNTTDSVANTETYDDLKVQAIINQIDGKNHAGTSKSVVPAIFGMSFQAVSVGQALAGAGNTDASGTPSSSLLDALNHTDQSIGKIVAELQNQHVLNTTLMIISAKHGQSAMDPSKRRLVSDTVIPALINSVQAGLAAHVTADDVGLIWLSDQTQTAAAVSALNANQTAAGINEILALEGIKLIFNDPLLDSRTPDIIVLPDMGVIYSGANNTAIAEHGGLKGQDTNVPILISNPVIMQTTIKTPVQTMQIAPTILRVLGLNPSVLNAAVLEHTRVLPGLGLEKDEGKIVY
jgi:hypothetical protein